MIAQCPCRACAGAIEFEVEDSGSTVKCPHCGSETVVALSEQDLQQTGGSASRSKTRGAALVIAGFVSGLLVMFILVAVLSPTRKPAATVQKETPPQAATETVTEEYARRINAFADKWDMTVERAMRYDYALTSRGLTLADLDEALAKIERSSDLALGYHPNRPKRNPSGRRLVIGETKLPQNPALTEDEEAQLKLLKLAGY